MQSEVFEGPWWQPPSCLDRDAHATLIANLDAVSDRAGLGQAYRKAIWEPLPDDTPERMRKWVQGRILREPRAANVRISGQPWAIRARCYQLAGALLRNFVDARVLAADGIVEDVLSGQGDVEATVLLIPDFCVLAETDTKPAAARRALAGVVRQRLVAGAPTVLGLPRQNELDHLSKAYGSEFAEELSVCFEPWSVAG